MKTIYLAIGVSLLPFTTLAASPEPTDEIVRLLKAIEERKDNISVMPGTNTTSLEEQLIIELAKEVLRLKEENKKLASKVETLIQK